MKETSKEKTRNTHENKKEETHEVNNTKITRRMMDQPKEVENYQTSDKRRERGGGRQIKRKHMIEHTQNFTDSKNKNNSKMFGGPRVGKFIKYRSIHLY